MEPAYSVIIPAYNEAASLSAVLDRLVTYVGRNERRGEIVVIDDGSTDTTRAIADEYARVHPGLVYAVHHPANLGLVAGLRSGAAAAHAPIVIVLDADLSYAPETIGPLLEGIDAGADMVLASPYMRGGQVSHVPLGRLVASRGANLILSACTFGRIRTFTGMVRAYRAAVFREFVRLDPPGEFNSSIVVEALRRGYRIAEIPAHLNWPPERYTAPSRIPLSKLYRRSIAVIRTAGILIVLSASFNARSR